MIALDTNAIVRVLTEDDVVQSNKVQAVIHQAEKLFSFDRKLQNRFPDFVTEN